MGRAHLPRLFIGDVRERTDLRDELKRKVLGENARRFYGLGVPVAAS